MRSPKLPICKQTIIQLKRRKTLSRLSILKSVWTTVMEDDRSNFSCCCCWKNRMTFQIKLPYFDSAPWAKIFRFSICVIETYRCKKKNRLFFFQKWCLKWPFSFSYLSEMSLVGRLNILFNPPFIYCHCVESKVRRIVDSN